MEVLAAISLITTVIKTLVEVAPVVVDGFHNIDDFGEALFQKLTGKEITPEQRKLLQDNIVEMHQRFQKPIPPVDQR